LFFRTFDKPFGKKGEKCKIFELMLGLKNFLKKNNYWNFTETFIDTFNWFFLFRYNNDTKIIELEKNHLVSSSKDMATGGHGGQVDIAEDLISDADSNLKCEAQTVQCGVNVNFGYVKTKRSIWKMNNFINKEDIVLQSDITFSISQTFYKDKVNFFSFLKNCIYFS
jgi:hypothetical protein